MAETASAIWTLLEREQLPIQIESLMPKRKRRSADEDGTFSLVAKQSLVVALDCAIVAADQGVMLTFQSRVRRSGEAVERTLSARGARRRPHRLRHA